MVELRKTLKVGQLFWRSSREFNLGRATANVICHFYLAKVLEEVAVSSGLKELEN